MRSVLFLSTILFLACGPTLRSADDSDVTLQVEPSAAAPGDTVTLILLNRSTEEVGYNLCTSTLERLLAGEWQPVRSDRVCTMELRTLAAGDEARYPMQIPPGTAAGEYRFRTNIDALDAGDPGSVASDTLTIAG